MTSLFTRIGLAAIVALSGIAATATTVSASERGFGPNGAGIYVQYNDRHHDRGRDWRRHNDRPGCSPGRALDKAERMGLRRARIVDASRRAIVVVGRDRHGRDRVVFANERGCPVIRR
ncbi:hypothetical protein [Aliirhizobium smilacinae]|uniref:Antifreeze protein n=1 Tax=Aliirhizobium smilacinae TaxID=1395944 RepID=A0A5C4XFN2_9HYPH|nr:hypothetical protein [Rhizobium smilacinae]TNM62325.1 hypothetical protein FHP24_19815 [Rhizobium smilacinae]